ncbi:MAG: hypothetical protein DCC43_08360 [Candidatus Brocadia sp.]|uniref:DUF5666 domain-containing protein n=1 Tax=Candidatus Brocadia fulgida TaxID=380242 RepID=A0A0M2UZ01_9BACT|nr:MAG: hypothetical protein BROFUL_00435 [Candidatus Brocadia fulgida]MCC6325063.1 hypothetical protein [Candidatus Brocadia sp.]MCE7912132.1 hypothetical protein [Candidatus Brocadia sp. AMX3]MBV6518380.1 hypothetical protein [Candidatus Brocadia fulgida]MDG5996605.1 hypothetical protein [Candidatus Brocadia sp.]
MKNYFKVLIVSLFLVLCLSSAFADDLEGRIESINQSEKSFVVQGIKFFVTQSTDYDDGLKGFADLKEGQKVEVDFEYRDGKYFATEIELED